MTEPVRCSWCLNDPLNIRYHDEQWCVPNRDDRDLFEAFSLEIMEAGLNWLMILRKRENFRAAFANFDPQTVATFDEAKVEELMQNEGIVRYRRKLEGIIHNARMILEVQAEHGSFANFVWSFVDDTPIVHEFASYDDVPDESPEAKALSKALKAKGFQFAGPGVCYAFMQAIGMVNDHLTSCYRHPLNAG